MQVQAQSWQPEAGHVLVVEDDEFFGQVLIGTLQAAGFTATLALNGREALGVLAVAEAPCCIVTDLHMPHVNGFELIASLRARDGQPGTPIIVFSGQDEQSDIEKVFRLGATSFVPKPIHPLLLVHHVRLVLRAVRAGALPS